MTRSTDRRARLIAFIQPWSDARQQYRGSFGFDALPLSWLTDDALEEIADRIVYGWRRERRGRRRTLDRLPA